MFGRQMKNEAIGYDGRVATVEELTTLRAMIEHAFASAPRPTADDIATHACGECDRVRQTFRGADWRTIDQGTILENYDKLPLLTPEAHHYFLPAFMLASITPFDRDNPILEFTIYDVCDPRLERAEKFTTDQCDAIVAFLILAERDMDFSGADFVRGLRFWRKRASRA